MIPREILNGVGPAAYCLMFAFLSLIHPQFILLAPLILVVWFPISVIRLCQEALRGSYKRTAFDVDQECFSFWLGAFLSCLLAPIIFALTLVGL